MDMNFIKFLGINLVVWVLAGVVLFVPLFNLLNSYLGRPQRLSYKMGVLWGFTSGTLFFWVFYYKPPLKYVFIICGTMIVGSFVYRKFIKK